MAIVRELKPRSIGRVARQTETECTYAVIEDEDGKHWLQIETYGSSSRISQGTMSQSLRFSPEAVVQLRKILETEMK